MANYNRGGANSSNNRVSLLPQGRIPFVPTAEEIRENPIFYTPIPTYSEPPKPQLFLPKNYFKFPGHKHATSNDLDSNDPEDSFRRAVQKLKEEKLATVKAENMHRLVNAHYSSNDEDSSDEDSAVNLIARLRNKAMKLEQLGCDVPKEIRSVLDVQKSNREIMADFERRIPDNEDEFAVTDMDIEDTEPSPSSQIPSAQKPLFPSVSAPKSTTNNAPKIAARGTTATLKNISKVKLSARAREKIILSALTGKARNTNFIETEDGLKPAEEITMSKPEIIPKSEKVEIVEPISSLDEIGCSVTTIDSKVDILRGIKLQPTEKRSEETVKHETSSTENMYSFQSTSFIPNKKRPKPSIVSSSTDESTLKTASLVSICDEFVQSVKSATESNIKKSKLTLSQEGKRKESRELPSINEIVCTLDEENSLQDTCDLYLEKLKFLSSGTNPSNVEILAIQIGTLVTAWRAKALTSPYLKEWLKSAEDRCKSIEESAAPPGWICEWDRNFGRYYYRQKSTGMIQWDYPESSSSQRPKTPPPPNISTSISLQSMLPPPPPIISSSESRKRSELDRKRNSSVNSQLPPYSSFTIKQEQPPPPPSSPPPLPPPPPLYTPPVAKIEPDCSGYNESKPIKIKTERSSSPTFPFATFEVKKEESVDIPYDVPSVPRTKHYEKEMNSFYTDIAHIEAAFPINIKDEKIEIEEEKNDGIEYIYPQLPSEEQASLSTQKSKQKNENPKKKKKNKKVKLDSSLSLKKKELPKLFDRWTKQQADY